MAFSPESVMHPPIRLVSELLPAHGALFLGDRLSVAWAYFFRIPHACACGISYSDVGMRCSPNARKALRSVGSHYVGIVRRGPLELAVTREPASKYNNFLKLLLIHCCLNGAGVPSRGLLESHFVYT